jgi:hypothetical protein
VQFVLAGAAKGAALWAALSFEDAWWGQFAGWGGSAVAAFFLLAGIGFLVEVIWLRNPANHRSDERQTGAAFRTGAWSLGGSLAALGLAAAFVLVGNTIPFVVGIVLVCEACLLALAISFQLVWARVLAAARTRLDVRLVAGPEARPGMPSGPAATITAAPGITSADSSPSGPAPVEAPAGEAAQLRVRCAGARVRWNVDVAVVLDGRWIGVGSLRGGFDARAETSLGAHVLEVRRPFLTESFVVSFPQPGAYEAELSYSRLWARFRGHGGHGREDA